MSPQEFYKQQCDYCRREFLFPEPKRHGYLVSCLLACAYKTGLKQVQDPAALTSEGWHGDLLPLCKRCHAADEAIAWNTLCDPSKDERPKLEAAINDIKCQQTRLEDAHEKLARLAAAQPDAGQLKGAQDEATQQNVKFEVARFRLGRLFDEQILKAKEARLMPRTRVVEDTSDWDNGLHVLPTYYRQ